MALPRLRKTLSSGLLFIFGAHGCCAAFTFFSPNPAPKKTVLVMHNFCG
jgi:hypothetical protein